MKYTPIIPEFSKIFRFFVTGALNTVFGYSLYAMLIFMGIFPHAAQFIGRSIGVVFNYFTYGRITFVGKKLSKSRFLLSYLANYLIAAALLAVLIEVLRNPYIAGLVVMVLSTAINFVFLRMFAVQPLSQMADEIYAPYRTFSRWMPEWMLLPKDFIRDTSLAVIDRLRLTPVGRSVWWMIHGRRLARRIDASGFLLIHIPKTAGTSISHVLYHRNLPHFTAATYRALFGTKFDNWASFAVIRDPVQRFLSAYRFTLQGGTDLMLTSRFERLRLGKMMPLADFISRLEAEPALLDVAPQFSLQSRFITSSERRVLVDRLYTIDTSSEQSKALEHWLGIKKIPHLNASSPINMELNEDLIRRIREIYASDVDLYDRIHKQGGCLVVRNDEDVTRDLYEASSDLRCSRVSSCANGGGG